jgi:hypothetical protein
MSMQEELYADTLVTPHPEKPASGEVPQILSAVIRHQGFKEQLADIGDQAEYEENALAAAHIICSQVREALWYAEPEDFSRFGVEDDIIHLSELPEKQVARCIGFTVVASECLELTGINHWIGFANGHSTIVLPTEEGRQLNLADPLSPVLSQDLQHSMVRGGSDEHTVNDDMREVGQSAVELNTLSMARRARGNTIELLRDHTWLMFRRGGAQDAYSAEQDALDLVAGRDHRDRSVHPSRARVFMKLFLPQEGRRVLHDYDDFRRAYSRDELLDAAGVLYDRLGGNYPDLDARQSHSSVRAVVRELAGMGSAIYAQKLLDEYFESFALMSDDSRVPEAHADCLMVVARHADDPQAASEAAAIQGCRRRQIGQGHRPGCASEHGMAAKCLT